MPTTTDTDLGALALANARALDTHLAQLDVALFRLTARRFGAKLRLRFHTTDARFYWTEHTLMTDADGQKHWRWPSIGAHVSSEVLNSLHRTTRDAITQAAGWVQLRRDTRSVYHALEKLAMFGIDTPSDVLIVKWRGDLDRGATTWAYSLQGHVVRSSTFDLASPSPSASPLARDLPLTNAVWHTGSDHSEMVTRLLDRLLRVQADLHKLADELVARRAPVRLYWAEGKRAWELRELVVRRELHRSIRTRHLSTTTLVQHLPRLQPAALRGTAATILDRLTERAALRRMLQIIADVTKAAIVWPGGWWTISGHRRQSQTAEWRIMTTRSGRALTCDYRRRGTPSADHDALPAATFDEAPFEDGIWGPSIGAGGRSEA